MLSFILTLSVKKPNFVYYDITEVATFC